MITGGIFIDTPMTEAEIRAAGTRAAEGRNAIKNPETGEKEVKTTATAHATDNGTPTTAIEIRAKEQSVRTEAMKSHALICPYPASAIKTRAWKRTATTEITKTRDWSSGNQKSAMKTRA